jgi:Ni,Fe-hydrogenase I small subunit
MKPAASRSGVSRGDAAPISEIAVLWITAGLGCDGDMIAVTVATLPSIEDLVLVAFAWIPRVNFHNPFLAYENGDEFVRYSREASEGISSPFILVIEGSIPSKKTRRAVVFDEEAARRNIQTVRPRMEVFKPNAKTGEGMAEYLKFLEGWRVRSRVAAAV